MSSYPTDDPIDPTTPLFDQTVAASAVRPEVFDSRSGSATSSGAGDQAKQAAGQAKDTAKQAAGQAKDQAQQVGSTAKEQASNVASTAKEQASNVASDAVGQAKELYGQATSQLSDQAGKQQKNAATTLRTFGDDLAGMHGQQDANGLAAELVQNLSQRAGRVADWLEDREPAEVLDEVKQFAARRPGLFIGLAAVAGIVAARATKALVAEAKPSHDEAAGTHVSQSSATSGRPVAQPVEYEGSVAPVAPVAPAVPTAGLYGDVR